MSKSWQIARYASVDREIRRENPNYKTVGYTRVKREQALFVLRREMETYGVGNISSAYRKTWTSCSSWVESDWKQVRHNDANASHTAIILWTHHRISVSYSFGTNAADNVVILCPFDWTQNRLTHRSIRPYLYHTCTELNATKLRVSSSHSYSECRSSLQHCSVMGGGNLRGGVNLKRRNARRRFKISALCIGGQFLAVISSAAIS